MWSGRKWATIHENFEIPELERELRTSKERIAQLEQESREQREAISQSENKRKSGAHGNATP